MRKKLNINRFLRQFAEGFHQVFQPANAVEYALVEEIVDAKWRLRRSWGTEGSLDPMTMVRNHAKVEKEFGMPGPNIHYAAAFERLANNTDSLNQLHRQETRLARLHDKALNQLLTLQQIRRESEEGEQNEDTPENPTRKPQLTPTQPTENKQPNPARVSFAKQPQSPRAIPPKWVRPMAMACTSKYPSMNLKLHEQPEPEVSSQPQAQGIPLEDWEQFQRALVEALRPCPEAPTAAAYAIRDLQLRLGRTM